MRLGAPSPRLGDELELLVLQLGDRPHVPAAVHDDLLPFQRRVEIRDDANAPLALFREDECLWRCHVLVTGAERTRLQLLLRRRIGTGPCRARTLRSAGRDHHRPPGGGVTPQLACQRVPSPFGMKGRMMSIGAGKTIVVDCDAPSSSNVWR